MGRTWTEAAEQLAKLNDELERLQREGASVDAWHDAFIRGLERVGQHVPNFRIDEVTPIDLELAAVVRLAKRNARRWPHELVDELGEDEEG